jgi:hypothetical protein
MLPEIVMNNTAARHTPSCPPPYLIFRYFFYRCSNFEKLKYPLLTFKCVIRINVRQVCCNWFEAPITSVGSKRWFWQIYTFFVLYAVSKAFSQNSCQKNYQLRPVFPHGWQWLQPDRFLWNFIILTSLINTSNEGLFPFITSLYSITETFCVLYVLLVEAEETAELPSMIDFTRRVSTLKSYRL